MIWFKLFTPRNEAQILKCFLDKISSFLFTFGISHVMSILVEMFQERHKRGALVTVVFLTGSCQYKSTLFNIFSMNSCMSQYPVVSCLLRNYELEILMSYLHYILILPYSLRLHLQFLVPTTLKSHQNWAYMTLKKITRDNCQKYVQIQRSTVQFAGVLTALSVKSYINLHWGKLQVRRISVNYKFRGR